MLPSDYATYSLLSKRFFSIVRRYTPDVEEYSIDECFADLTGLRRPLGMKYIAIAQKIKQELDAALGFTFSVGLWTIQRESDESDVVERRIREHKTTARKKRAHFVSTFRSTDQDGGFVLTPTGVNIQRC